ncbi:MULTISPECIES: DUF2267 domain-containing protein [Streptomycetaceae]|uniref:DUF2267 domain-containing protein n=1 Tax=Streptantibioticus cattleyicolor (strain ATCC 35852 / DSM 46488 / JCM 4925 / NBRC 14057 / NRRL 8057) TaxID=1003195 RepID=F8JNT1_STREN|nr:MULTISPECIES: DUF2267 domain-containing protein [Streptomycetaceae]AEW92661.1 hypothetical protein SCATT_02900 [Streptantibioticus cattleyicolor NRRL 8057 = DSM 46488]MYS57434.1 DUF2267 domain-containing protein [Streptomyces sp. SID5468]CCB73016.1 conserved protein of unknown function [Streptantibioticus cattleyicolor NRRL 8057 = DSM 46488]
MDYPTFLAAVRERGHYDRAEAERVTTAVVGTLGDRLAPGTAGNLADQLPAELSETLNDARALPRDWGVREFVHHVAETTGDDERTAEAHTRTVLSVLAQQIGGGELDKTLSQLPSGYADLFGVAELR